MRKSKDEILTAVLEEYLTTCGSKKDVPQEDLDEVTSYINNKIIRRIATSMLVKMIRCSSFFGVSAVGTLIVIGIQIGVRLEKALAEQTAPTDLQGLCTVCADSMGDKVDGIVYSFIGTCPNCNKDETAVMVWRMKG